jgi:hypothetical protein
VSKKLLARLLLLGGVLAYVVYVGVRPQPGGGGGVLHGSGGDDGSIFHHSFFAQGGNRTVNRSPARPCERTRPHFHFYLPRPP